MLVPAVERSSTDRTAAVSLRDLTSSFKPESGTYRAVKDISFEAAPSKYSARRFSRAEGMLDTTGVFAGMTVLAEIVLAVGALVNRLEGWLLRWKPGREVFGQAVA